MSVVKLINQPCVSLDDSQRSSVVSGIQLYKAGYSFADIDRLRSAWVACERGQVGGNYHRQLVRVVRKAQHL